MLKPGARATICRFQWMGRESKPSAVDDAVRSLRERDAEADALLNLHVEVEGWSLGIVSRLCATAVADVVRATPVAILPMPGGMDHTGHHSDLQEGRPCAISPRSQTGGGKQMMRQAILGALMGVSVVMMAATPHTAAAKGKSMVLLSTSLGDIKIELYPDKAPETVKNFLAYVEGRLLRRHDLPPRHPRLHDPGRRLDRGHEGQAGGTASRRSRTSRRNGLKNEAGTIAMARTSAPRQRHLAVLHQREGQRLPRTRRRPRTASATRSSARSSTEWTW